MKNFEKFTSLMLIIGAINWGLIGLFQFDLIQYVLGQTWLDRAAYLVIGFSAIFKLVCWKSNQKA